MLWELIGKLWSTDILFWIVNEKRKKKTKIGTQRIWWKKFLNFCFYIVPLSRFFFFCILNFQIITNLSVNWQCQLRWTNNSYSLGFENLTLSSSIFSQKILLFLKISFFESHRTEIFIYYPMLLFNHFEIPH